MDERSSFMNEAEGDFFMLTEDPEGFLWGTSGALLYIDASNKGS